MKKFLVLLSAVIFPVFLNLAVCGCRNIENRIIRKIPITQKNLETFFKENKVFKYVGEFFFKDISQQLKTETSRMTETRITNFFKCLLDETLGQKIRKYFTYDASKYYFKIMKLTHISAFKLGQPYEFKFQLEIIGEKNSFYFKQDNLVLLFTETKQYDDAMWLKFYTDYLKICCTFLWQQKYSGYEKSGFLPYHPDIEWKTEEEKEVFKKTTDEPAVLNFFSNFYTALLSETNSTKIDKDKSLWFYNDKQFQVTATNYKYLGETPKVGLYQNGGVRAKVNLKFTSITNSSIIATREYDIWMGYKKNVEK